MSSYVCPNCGAAWYIIVKCWSCGYVIKTTSRKFAAEE